ncbi:hypothetical protein RhiirA1_461227 [Rhizophagus irregularis]|uniref:F-box domain-containing protein n=1 Tax=Rhizophagus irregularis TaxID=588596 RepID=A0A2N0RPU6_9GLOM|nr:hypothetical protein RhiirA1_461227 [Rhizophagus irregularis]
MACSKIFSGDLPELINEVIQYFRYDYKTLHSCILVCRLWCRLTIPLLWEDPFSMKLPKNYHFIEIYLHNLNDYDKLKLNEYGISNELFPSNTLFDYPRFIQHLNTFKISSSVESWVVTVHTSTNLSDSQISNFTKFIYKSLFLIFIENEVNLHSFKIMMLNDIEFEYFDEIFELFLQNPNLICNIKNFKIDFDRVTDNLTTFLRAVYSNCNSISSIDFQFISYYDYYYPMIEKNLSQIIESQVNLKSITFGYNCPFLYHLSLSLKSYNCSNTLNTIIFCSINFKNIDVLSEVFNQLNVLESIHIVYCYSLDSKFIQQINNITKPFKLKSLFLHSILQIEPLKLLIQKSNNYLENFGITSNKPQQLLQLIITHCSKIKYLGPITKLNYQTVYSLFNLIENMAQNLNYLMIDDFTYMNCYIGPIILQNLGQILPFKLEYLNLYLKINKDDFEVFLKNSQNTFIKKLLIRNKNKEGNKDIFPCIEKYIMKKKRVKYLAIDSFNVKYEDVLFLEGKVEEFKLHDIQVLNYNDLNIQIYDFISEVD